jgi:hypothetical protein
MKRSLHLAALAAATLAAVFWAAPGYIEPGEAGTATG